MYRSPQRIWVRALLRQFRPALDIFDPGTACGMPSAAEYGVLGVDVPAALPVPQPVQVRELAAGPPEVPEHPAGDSPGGGAVAGPGLAAAARPAAPAGLREAACDANASRARERPAPGQVPA